MVDFNQLFGNRPQTPDPIQGLNAQASLRNALANQQNANINAQKAGPQIDQLREETKGKSLQNELQRVLAPIQREQALADVDKTKAETVSKTANSELVRTQARLQRLNFSADRYDRVNSAESLKAANDAAIKNGILTPEQVPTSVAEARFLADGGQMAKIKLKHKLQVRRLKEKTKSDLQFLKEKAKLDLKQAKEIAIIKQKIFQKRSEIEHKLGVSFEALKQSGRERLATMSTGRPAPTFNINIPQRADGGPVNEGQPTLVGERGPEVLVEDDNSSVVGQSGPEVIVPQNDGQVISNEDSMQLALNEQSDVDSRFDEAFETSDDFKKLMSSTTDEIIRARQDLSINPANLVKQDNKNLKLNKPVQNKVQQELIDKSKDFDDIKAIASSFDPEAFSLVGRLSKEVAQAKDFLNVSSEEDKELLRTRFQQHSKIQALALIWRKYITGVAGGEKEMQQIIDTTLNTSLSPAQAQGALENLMGKVVRDQLVYKRLSQEGVNLDNTDKDAYNKRFAAERQNLEQSRDQFISSALSDPRNKALGMKRSDALLLWARETEKQLGQ